MFKEITFQTVDIQQSDVNDIAIQIRKGMPDVTKKTYLDFLQHLESLIKQKQTDKLRPYDPETGCLVTNLSRLPAHRLEFGQGIPELVFPLTVGKNAASVLADKDNFILRFVY
jgi:muramidase (phage lysozyme)